jgi:hypothetical protein
MIKNILLIAVTSVFLTGCFGSFGKVKPELVTADRVEYVLRTPPAEFFTIPDQVKNIDLETAKQSDIARWVLATEKRVYELENKILGIASFLKGEDAKLQKDAAAENKKSLEDAITKQSNAAKETIDTPVKK